MATVARLDSWMLSHDGRCPQECVSKENAPTSLPFGRLQFGDPSSGPTNLQQMQAPVQAVRLLRSYCDMDVDTVASLCGLGGGPRTPCVLRVLLALAEI